MTRATPEPSSGASVAHDLIAWFRKNARDLPWRRTRDPYAVWVSEVMLQQTQVATVLPYYARWMARFPDPVSLASADQQEVLKLWEGLGYYSRARNFHRAVQAVVADHGGEVPADWKALRALPGVGDYTAGAVLSFALNLPHPAVDGNVIRVLTRVHAVDADVTLPATRKRLEGLAAALIPEGHARELNSALMELGALVCTPRRPDCASCPVAGACAARTAGDAQGPGPEAYPVKAKKRPPRPVDAACAVLWHEGRVLLARRPEDGLLGGLWEFPTVQAANGEAVEACRDRLMADLGVSPGGVAAALSPVRHTFTHLEMTLHPFALELGRAPDRIPDASRWVEVPELAAFPLSSMHAKVAKAVAAGTRV